MGGLWVVPNAWMDGLFFNERGVIEAFDQEAHTERIPAYFVAVKSKGGKTVDKETRHNMNSVTCAMSSRHTWMPG